MKIFRWWGIGVFIGLVLLITLIWFLLAPKIIADGIREIGTEALGAKVDVDDVSLTLAPLSVTVKRIAATNPDKPMENLVEMQSVKFSIDSSALLWKKLIIDELAIEGFKVGTARKVSGQLAGGRKTEKMVENIVELALPEGQQWDVKAAVDKADLLTLKRVDAFKVSQNAIQQQWNQALDKEAFDKRIKGYEQEYQRLSDRLKANKLNFIKDQGDWKKLKKSIDEERKQINGLSAKLKQDKEQLANQLQAVKKGPQDDLNKLMDNFGLGQGVDGLVDKYLGPQYTPWVKRALAMAQEMRNKSQQQQQADEKAMVQVGEKVLFNDHKSFPELLIKRITLSGGDTDWNMAGHGFDLGYLPWITGNPAKLDAQLDGTRVARIDLISEWASSSKMNTKLTSRVKKWPIEKMSLMKTAQGDWEISSGNFTAEIDGSLTLEAIDLSATFSIQTPKLMAPQGISDWQSTLASSINKQASIDFKLNAKGSLSEPKIKLSSSLEKLFQQAIGEKLKQQGEKLKEQAKQAINDKVGNLSTLDEYTQQFKNYQSQIADKDKLLEGLLAKIKL